MGINCIIIDDEPLAIRLLENHVSKIPHLKLAGKATNAMEAYQLLQSHHAELMFLDIQMPDMNGIDFLKSLHRKPKTILTTAFRDFALEGFELEVIDYLLKPITFERFFKGVERVLRVEIQGKDKVSENDFIIVKSGGFQHKIYYRNILYVESQGNEVKIFLQDQQPLFFKKQFSELEELLPAKEFIRIHRSFIINNVYVSAFNHSEILLGKVTIPVGRTYKENVEKLVKNLLHK